MSGTVSPTTTPESGSATRILIATAAGHHRGDEQGGQVAAEVALEPVEPAGGQRGQLTGRRQVGVAGAEPQDVRDQGGPQRAHDVGRRTVRGDLARPRQPGPDGHHREHAEQGGA